MQAPPQRQNSATSGNGFSDTIVLQSGDESRKLQLEREDERQKLFHRTSNKYFDVPNGYLQVEVLVLRWEKSLDQFKEHDGEIERLCRIFEKGFGYRCHVREIGNERSPQNGLNNHISSHVHNHDGKNNLLIVYYTGHGSEIHENGENRLLLSATSNWDDDNSGYRPEAYWDLAEAPLKEHAASDVLTILDCCFASIAAEKGVVHDSRIYQLLAASTAGGRTSAPGENSFTHALCSSLEKLLEDASEETFSVFKLWQTINTKRRTQAALVWDRLQRYHRNVELGKLAPPQEERKESFRKEEHEKSSLTLKLSLTTDDLKNVQIESLARNLHQACSTARVPVRRIKWVRFEHSAIFRAANQFKRAGARRKSSSGKVSGADNEPETRKRTRSSTSKPTESKRQAIQGAEMKVYGEPASRYRTPLSDARSGSPASD